MKLGLWLRHLRGEWPHNGWRGLRTIVHEEEEEAGRVFASLLLCASLLTRIIPLALTRRLQRGPGRPNIGDRFELQSEVDFSLLDPRCSFY